ncbi:MAG: glycoside hydrolase, partial [Acidobacteria bacterium]
MRWRLIGPYRGGRVTAVAGISGDPTVYYMGTPGGGVWKTTDGGRVWNPIFDDQHVASIGAVALAPSNPNIIYVGTGEQTRGNGVYKSSDTGATWTHIGLEKAYYISSIVVDPRNPEIVIVGVLVRAVTSVSSEPPEHGVFKSVNGGKTWTRTLSKDALDGIADMCADPGNPREIFAAMWHPPDPSSNPDDKNKQDGWIYRSTDEGS